MRTQPHPSAGQPTQREQSGNGKVAWFASLKLFLGFALLAGAEALIYYVLVMTDPEVAGTVVLACVCLFALWPIVIVVIGRGLRGYRRWVLVLFFGEVIVETCLFVILNVGAVALVMLAVSDRG